MRIVVPYQDSNDEALLAAWRMGDQHAGATLFKRYHASVARFFGNKLGFDTDDLVSETFLGLQEGLERFRGECKVRTLIFAIARNKLLKRLRNLTRDKKRFHPGEMSIAALDPTPTAKIAAKDQNKLLLAALRELPIDTQMVLELHYWDGLQVLEIARVLDSPIGTVKTRLQRGRKRLFELMRTLSESDELFETTLAGLEKWAARLREDLARADGPDR